MLNLLTEPLIRFDPPGQPRAEASLPEVYEALLADRVEAFPALRPHQRHAWHAFLVQLGAMALHQAGLHEPPPAADEWRELLRALTSDDWPGDEPWHLVVDDITQPAFMQPPARAQERQADYKSAVNTPDELDMLVTSKNHDLKAAVAAQAGADDWLIALITLQTMEGYGGAGNHGISRINGGLGNRPAFSLAPAGQSPGAHIRRDIIALLEYRPQLLADSPMIDGGAGLLWTLPWDGAPAESLLLDRLDPFYIEICRRIRLRSAPDSASGAGLRGLRATSKAARIEGKALKGRTGDPWTPVNQGRDGLPLTLSAGGFTYKRVTEYLTSSDWNHPPLLKPTPAESRSDGGMQLVARAMVRGQGKTEGYHERIIPLRHKVKMAMLRRSETQELGDIAQSRIVEVGAVQRILSHAIQTFMARGDSEQASPEHRALARPWLNRLDEIVDARFFDGLQTEFEAAESDRPAIRKAWLHNNNDGVIDHARLLLREATESLPCPAIYRYKAQVNAEGLFEGRLRGNAGVPNAFDEPNGEG